MADSKWNTCFRFFVYTLWTAFFIAMVALFVAEPDQNLAMSQRDDSLWLRPGGSVSQDKNVFPSAITNNANVTDVYRNGTSEFVCEPVNDDDWIYTLTKNRFLRGYNKFRNPTDTPITRPPRIVNLSPQLFSFSCSISDDDGRATMVLFTPGTDEVGIIFSCASKIVLIAVRFEEELNSFGDWDYVVRSESFGNYGAGVVARSYSSAFYDGSVIYNAGIVNTTTNNTLHVLCSVEIKPTTLLSSGPMILEWCVTLSDDDRVYSWNFAISYKSGCVYVPSVRNGTTLYLFKVSLNDGSGQISEFPNASFANVSSNFSYKGKLTLTKSNTKAERVLVTLGYIVAAFDQEQIPGTKTLRFKGGASAFYPPDAVSVSSLSYDGESIYALRRTYDGGFIMWSGPTCRLSFSLLNDETLLPEYEIFAPGSEGSECNDALIYNDFIFVNDNVFFSATRDEQDCIVYSSHVQSSDRSVLVYREGNDEICSSLVADFDCLRSSFSSAVMLDFCYVK
jgi:hypothetical protein